MKLVIAEKPSVAGEIAKVIGCGKRENGFYIGKDYLVSWCVGHLIETVMPETYDEKYAKWRVTDLPIMPDKWEYKVTPSVQSQFFIIKNLMERDDVDGLICATDAGREGELIFRLVYNFAKCSKPVKRLWISSMENKAIKEGFEKMKDAESYDNLYMAALARMQADWLVGINFSRLFSCMENNNINIGRVQTPTVNLIVERQRAIDSFDAKPFYVITAMCDGFNAAKRVESKEENDKIIAKCVDEQGNAKNGTVKNVTKTPQKENPPPLYDLTTLQREANKMLGLSAQQTLDIAQNLYEKKLITYPRTDSKYLTADMKGTVLSTISAMLQASLINPETEKAYKLENISTDRLINDKKVTDHHAILPTVEVNKPNININEQERNVLLMVAYKLLQSAYIPYEYIKTEVILEIENEEFKASGKYVTEQGFKEIAAHLTELIKKETTEGPKKRQSKKKKEEQENSEGQSPDSAVNEEIPPLEDGQTVDVKSLESKEKATTPPKPYTEDTLLSAMENAMRTLEDEELKKEVASAGLGTPATRAGIIERIIKTGFVERKGKNMLPTEKAFKVIDVVPEKVKSPLLTAEWEQKLEQIYKEGFSKEDFIKSIEDFVKELVESLTKDCIYDDRGREIIGKCPRCQGNIYEGKQNYYCEKGQECGFTIWKQDNFFINKRKPLTRPMVKAFLNRGRIKAVNLYSEKKDITYSAYIIMEDTGKYVNFKLHFPR